MSATLEAMDIAEILRCLPHRYPFLLVDRLYDIKPFKSCRGIKNVTINEQYFMGHFPEQPIMPGVLIVESMAQTAGAMLIKSMGDLSKGSLMYFLAMDEVKFRKPVLPGDQMIIDVKVIQNRNTIWKCHAIATVDSTKVAEATCTAMIKTRES